MMSDAALAILEQMKALSPEERREVLAAMPETVAVESNVAAQRLEKIYDALAWRYQGEPDDAARVDELRR